MSTLSATAFCCLLTTVRFSTVMVVFDVSLNESLRTMSLSLSLALALFILLLYYCHIALYHCKTLVTLIKVMRVIGF